MNSSRRQFLSAAAAAAGLGLLESGCDKQQRRLVVFLHGMMILDFRGLTIRAYMPLVPAEGMSSEYPMYGHEYCLSHDCKTTTKLSGAMGTMSEYLLGGLIADRVKPVYPPDQHIILRAQNDSDLRVKPECIVVMLELPFPNCLLPLRASRRKTTRDPMTGGDAAKTYNTHPTSVPLVYALVYDLYRGEQPYIQGTDGRRMWAPGSPRDYVHVHAEPKCQPWMQHFGHMTHAFSSPIDLTLPERCYVTSDPATGQGTPLGCPDEQLYGLPGQNPSSCSAEKPTSDGKPVMVCAEGTDPGNCASLIVDDGSGG